MVGKVGVHVLLVLLLHQLDLLGVGGSGGVHGLQADGLVLEGGLDRSGGGKGKASGVGCGEPVVGKDDGRLGSSGKGDENLEGKVEEIILLIKNAKEKREIRILEKGWTYPRNCLCTGCSLNNVFFFQEFSKVCYLSLASTRLLLVVQRITSK